MKKKKKIEKKPHVRQTKVCVLCEKPHKMKTQLCAGCNRKAVELANYVPSIDKKASVNKLVWLKNKFQTTEIFSIVKNNPDLYNDGSNKRERLAHKNQLRGRYRSDLYKQEIYVKWESSIPDYIINQMKKHNTKELLTLSGEKFNPNVHYMCLACGEEQVQTYNNLLKGNGHNCTSSKSSGEILVEQFLRKRHQIRIQRETLCCTNPITNRQMPYDIEIPSLKILIEIQGQQHFEFIEYFHGSIENFYYQQRKDNYKKLFAEKNGYTLIYITYDDIKTNEYINKLTF